MFPTLVFLIFGIFQSLLKLCFIFTNKIMFYLFCSVFAINADMNQTHFSASAQDIGVFAILLRLRSDPHESTVEQKQA